MLYKYKFKRKKKKNYEVVSTSIKNINFIKKYKTYIK